MLLVVNPAIHLVCSSPREKVVGVGNGVDRNSDLGVKADS